MIPKLHKGFDVLVHPIEGKLFSQVRDAIVGGVTATCAKRGLPFVHIELPDKSEQSIGQVLQMKMMEVMYLAYLLNVNAFDQPNVEEYKEEARKLLARK